jgi:hypothetical protein
VATQPRVALFGFGDDDDENLTLVKLQVRTVNSHSSIHPFIRPIYYTRHYDIPAERATVKDTKLEHQQGPGFAGVVSDFLSCIEKCPSLGSTWVAEHQCMEGKRLTDETASLM